MKITYKYGQEFELKEIDMWHNKLVFETTDSMGNFEPTNLNPIVEFKIPFSNIKELQNIPKLLNDYLKENNLIN